MSRLLLLGCMFLFVSMAEAKNYTLRNARPDDVNHTVVVFFANPPEDVNLATDVSKWSLTGIDSGLRELVFSIAAVRIPAFTVRGVTYVGADAFRLNHQVELVPSPTVPPSILKLIVTFNAGDFPPTAVYPDNARTAAGPLFSPAKGAKDANIYLNGIWVPARGNKPLYTLDGKIDYSHSIQGESALLGYWGLKASAKTDSRQKADPDSFSTAAYFERSLLRRERVHLSEIRLHWDVAGSEFDKKARTLNFISAPAVTFSVPLVPGLTLDLVGGMELGHNFKNRITSDGLGFISRGLLEANAYAFRKIPFIGLPNARIALTGNYELRLPIEDEPYTRGKGGPILTTRARNSVTTTVDFMLFDHLGITFKHQYGALPPTFSFVEHKGSVGLTLQLKQNPRR